MNAAATLPVASKLWSLETIFCRGLLKKQCSSPLFSTQSQQTTRLNHGLEIAGKILKFRKSLKVLENGRKLFPLGGLYSQVYEILDIR